MSGGNRGRVAGALALIVLGVLLVVNNSIAGSVMDVAWPAAFLLGAVGFGWAYAGDRELWTAIVSYVSGALGLILALALFNVDNLWMPELALILIGVPFLYVWFRDRAQWWALIPAYVMFVLVLMFVVLGENSDLIPSYVLAAIGLPFLYVWARDRAQWWYLVPALIMIGMALIFLFAGADYNALPALIMAVVGIPFVVIALITRKWLLLVPGAILLLFAVAIGPVIEGNYDSLNTVTLLSALLLIGGGVYLLWDGRRQEEEPLLKRKHE